VLLLKQFITEGKPVFLYKDMF